MPFRAKSLITAFVLGLTSATTVAVGTGPALAGAQLLIEADSGRVLHAENATYPWYPASLTKLMTLYVTLHAVKEGRIKTDSLITVTPSAVAQAPAKMGFKNGTQLTVDNAIKMLMVKSANDMAVTLAEGVSGSIENFADEMNRSAQRLGMTQTSYVNPNGLPADGQISSARDLGILARALIREFPEYDHYWHIPAMKFGKRVTRNYNPLLGRYPGADGMKTGYICASGFNMVVSATRNGKRLIAVVLGAPSSAVRAMKAAQLLERGFNSGGLSWLTPSLGTVDALTPIDAAPPNLRDEMCGPHRRRPAVEEDAAEVASNGDSEPPVLLSSLRAPNGKPFSLSGPPLYAAQPVEVFIGPPKKSAGSQIASAAAAIGNAVKLVKPIAAKPGQIAPALVNSGTAPAAAPGAVPWTSFTPTALANAPPSELTATLAETSVPLPRPRPRLAISQPRKR
ncbi:MAG: D-alanyl-D-alanine carboxypeptidase [Alphaproteobacteria bacterium]|nr:D-alanyl-D-alanine carboxypeptidase [Alphaproteobacteria bacterium]